MTGNSSLPRNPINARYGGLILIISLAMLAGGYMIYTRSLSVSVTPETALAARFNELSRDGNSTCSATFASSIDTMPDTDRIQGSCCSPMDLHRYAEQVTGLTKFKAIPEIPPDPYDIDAALAKQLKAYYDRELSSEQQYAYDYAMQNSHEKGPCCCKCWRWYVYGGLGKLLIQKYGFTGEQVTEIWNLSDGCGGAGEHVH